MYCVWYWLNIKYKIGELVVRTLLVEQEKSDHVQFNKDTTSVFTEKAEHIDMGCESHQFQATAFRRKLLLRAFDKGCVENIDEVCSRLICLINCFCLGPTNYLKICSILITT